MKHQGIAQWVDFARGLTPEPEGSMMREHLATGCPQCRQVLDFCDKLARLCLVMAPNRAPDAAARQARAIFPIRWPDRSRRTVRVPIELIYDSFLVPVPAGMRASWQVGWQALYRAGDCSLDLRIEPELQSSRAALIGQISNHTLPEIEMADIDQSTTSILDQSTTSILDQSTTSILDQQGALVLNQSTTSILDQSTTSILDRNRSKLPSAFGHGTMVAGLIHLVAPAAKLMPVKVFSGNGTSTLSNVVNGIYWAVDHGADVISMSFSSTQSSSELKNAIDYANSHGVICVASVGNDGQQNPTVFPAGYHSQVIAVASTNNQNIRSTFSNYGNILVDVAAPGEGVITLYPGNNYAEGWGTSFSAPLVAGGAALLVQLGRNHINGDQADQALSQAIPTGQGLGAGELDLFQACLYELLHGGWR